MIPEGFQGQVESVLRGIHALILILILFPAGMYAERACEQDPALTGRTCSVAECIALQDAVKSASACGGNGNPPPLSCRNVEGCEEKLRQRQRWQNCYTARKTINEVCFSGGDKGHQIQQEQALINIRKCDDEIAKPRPIGCGDPCPD